MKLEIGRYILISKERTKIPQKLPGFFWGGQSNDIASEGLLMSPIINIINNNDNYYYYYYYRE